MVLYGTHLIPRQTGSIYGKTHFFKSLYSVSTQDQLYKPNFLTIHVYKC